MMAEKLLVGMVFLIVLFSGCVQQAPEIRPEGDGQGGPDHTAEQPRGGDQEGVPDGDGHEGSPTPTQSPLFTDLTGCEEKEQVTFTASPLDLDAITYVEPQGELTDIHSGHITPGDHIGFQYARGGGAHNVYAMADGYLVRVERQPYSAIFGGAEGIKNYHLYFEYSCTVFGSYVHVTELAEELAAADPELAALDAAPNPEDTTNLYIRIPVRAGQIIGKAQDIGLLGMLTVDTAMTLDGFVIPEQYDVEPWKIHAVPPFDYFEEPIRSRLLEKNPRTTEPRGGKIDFDIDGKLAGNWFVEGTDYSGGVARGYCGDYLCPYWNGHLAFVYDFIDPQQIRVSIGYDAGLFPLGPYGVKGNAPDPATVDLSDGLVVYELVGLDDAGPEQGIFSEGKALITRNSETVAGVMLVEMRDERTIQIETFPGKTADGVEGFTEDARIYRR